MSGGPGWKPGPFFVAVSLGLVRSFPRAQTADSREREEGSVGVTGRSPIAPLGGLGNSSSGAKIVRVKVPELWYNDPESIGVGGQKHRAAGTCLLVRSRRGSGVRRES